MTITDFITSYKETFRTEQLPLAYRYTEEPAADTPKIGGCFFKCFEQLMQGGVVSLNAENIGCLGGKFYTGFTPMPPHIPHFVSEKEHYKQTPADVLQCVDSMGVVEAAAPWLTIMRIDRLETFDGIEGMIFIVTAEQLAGLCGWAFYDNNSPTAVTTLFGSGCSAMFANVTAENRRGGRSCFLGLFDPSVRPYIPLNHLGFGIPHSRLVEMLGTWGECFLCNSHAWEKVREKIDSAH